jgi:hypothetical protein
MATAPMSLDVILSEFSEEDDAWVLQDLASNKYIVLPDSRYPGRHPIRFFMTELDAKDLLDQILKVNEKLKGKNIVPVKVKLKTALRGIAAGDQRGMADSYVVHSPNEVYEFIRDQP